MKPLALMIGLFGAQCCRLCAMRRSWIIPSLNISSAASPSPYGGNAKDANVAIHTIDPWPPYVGNTRIPGDGRAVNAMEQMYRVPIRSCHSSWVLGRVEPERPVADLVQVPPTLGVEGRWVRRCNLLQVAISVRTHSDGVQAAAY